MIVGSSKACRPAQTRWDAGVAGIPIRSISSDSTVVSAYLRTEFYYSSKRDRFLPPCTPRTPPPHAPIPLGILLCFRCAGVRRPARCVQPAAVLARQPKIRAVGPICVAVTPTSRQEHGQSDSHTYRADAKPGRSAALHSGGHGSSSAIGQRA